MPDYSSWSNRTYFTIAANNNEALTDFQIRLDIQGADIDVAGHVDFSLASPYGNDLRVTLNDLTTDVDFWLADWDDIAETGLIFVKRSSIAAVNGSGDVVLHYGKAGVLSASSYINTMASARDISSDDLVVLDCNVGSGTNLPDTSGNSNNFTLSNSNMWIAGEIPTHPLAGNIGYGYPLALNATHIVEQATLLDVVPASGRIRLLFRFNAVFNSSSTNTFRLLSKTNDGAAPSGLVDAYFNPSTGGLVARLYDGTSAFSITGSNLSWSLGVWRLLDYEWGPDSTNGRFEIFIDRASEGFNATTAAMNDGTDRNFAFGSLIDSALNHKHIFDGDIIPIEVVNLTTNTLIESWANTETSGTTIAGTEGSHDLVLSSADARDITKTPLLPVDQTFPGNWHLDCDPSGTNQYADHATLLDVVPENLEIAGRFYPGKTSWASNEYLFSKTLNRGYPLYTNKLNAAQAIGKTILDRFPDRWFIEGTFDADFLGTGDYIFQKVNSEAGGSEERLDIYIDTGKLKVDLTVGGTTVSLTSPSTLSTSIAQWRIDGGDDGLAMQINGIFVRNDFYKDGSPGNGTARPLIYGGSNVGGTVANIFDGALGPMRIVDAQYSQGSIDSITSITRTGSVATVTMTHNYPNGAIVDIASWDQSEYNIPATVTNSDPASGTWDYAVSGTPATPATGTGTAQRQRGEVEIAKYGCLTSSGDVIDSVAAQDLTYSGSRNTIETFDALYGYFMAGFNLTFKVIRGWFASEIQASKTWDASTWYQLRFCIGHEGQFIYIEEDYLTDGAVDRDLRFVPWNGTSDNFVFGRQEVGGAGVTFTGFEGKMDGLSVSAVHTSQRRALAHIQRRKETLDPWVFQGIVVSNDNVSTSWGGGKKNFSEPSITYDGSVYRLITGSNREGIGEVKFTSIGLYNSSDGITFTDYASNPIIRGFTRCHLMRATDGTTATETVTPTTWAASTEYTTNSVVLPTTPNGKAYWVTKIASDSVSYLVNQVGHTARDNTVVIDTGSNVPQKKDQFSVPSDMTIYTVTDYDSGTLSFSPRSQIAFADNLAITFNEVSGSSGSTEPTWPTTKGDSVTQDGVTYECLADDSSPVFYKLFALALGDFTTHVAEHASEAMNRFSFIEFEGTIVNDGIVRRTAVPFAVTDITGDGATAVITCTVPTQEPISVTGTGTTATMVFGGFGHNYSQDTVHTVLGLSDAVFNVTNVAVTVVDRYTITYTTTGTITNSSPTGTPSSQSLGYPVGARIHVTDTDSSAYDTSGNVFATITAITAVTLDIAHDSVAGSTAGEVSESDLNSLGNAVCYKDGSTYHFFSEGQTKVTDSHWLPDYSSGANGLDFVKDRIVSPYIIGAGGGAIKDFKLYKTEDKWIGVGHGSAGTVNLPTDLWQIDSTTLENFPNLSLDTSHSPYLQRSIFENRDQITDIDFVQVGSNLHAYVVGQMFQTGNVLPRTLSYIAENKTFLQTLSPEPVISSSSGDISIIIADSLHSHTVDNLDLTQQNILVISSTTHSQSVDNLDLVQAHLLVIDDAIHAATVDNIALVQQNILAIADTLESQTVDNLELTQSGLLSVDEALSSLTSDNISLDVGLILAIADASHAQTADNIALIQANIITIADALHGAGVDNIDLTQASSLVVSDTLHSSLIDSISLVVGDLLGIDGTTHASLADNIIIAFSSGVVLIAPGDRVLFINTENKTLVIREEIKTLTIH